MPAETETEPQLQQVPVVCPACGGKEGIRRPFEHPDATRIFWCSTCGTLIDASSGSRVDAIVSTLTASVLSALTGYATVEDRVLAEREAATKAEQAASS